MTKIIHPERVTSRISDVGSSLEARWKHSPAHSVLVHRGFIINVCKVLRGSPVDMSFNWKGIAGDINQPKCQGTVASPKGQNEHTETTSVKMIPLTVLFQPSTGTEQCSSTPAWKLVGKDGKTASQRAGNWIELFGCSCNKRVFWCLPKAQPKLLQQH